MTTGTPSLGRLAPVPAPTTTLVEVGDEAILVDDQRGHLHLLNPSAALVVRLLDGVSSLDEICADLADAFSVDTDVVAGDVDPLARRLLDHGLLVASGYVRPPLPDEFEECDCGSTHGPDDVDVVDIPGNP